MGKDLHVVSFSGGKDSTAMVLVMLEKNMPIDYILWADTGVEFPEIYAHIKKFDKWLQEKHGLQITQVKAEYDFWEAITHLKRKRGRNAGQPYGFPSFKGRWCTTYLKYEPIQKFIRNIKSEKIVQYIGYALDEIDRANKLLLKYKYNNNLFFLFPLIKDNITEEHALNICYKYGFDFDGIYKHITRASCYCCPFINKQQLAFLYNYHPSILKKILKTEEKLKKEENPYYLFTTQKFWKEIREDLLKEFNLKD